MGMFTDGVWRVFHGKSLFQRHAPAHIHKLIVDFHRILTLPNLYRRRGRMHDPGKAGGNTSHVRVVFLIIVGGAGLFSCGRELEVFRFTSQQDPHAVQVCAFAGHGVSED